MSQHVALAGKDIRVTLLDSLRLTVSRDGRTVWASSAERLPEVTVRDGTDQQRTLPLAAARRVTLAGYQEGVYCGHAVRLTGYPGTDVVLELILALDSAHDELVVQVAQQGGADTIREVAHLYRWEKPVADGGYLVLPHGSGYLIPADCPDELPGRGPVGGTIGGRWTLPLFGIVKGADSLTTIVDTWWDCRVEAVHQPDACSSLDFTWIPSLGKLAYPRRAVYRFSAHTDHVGMAKWYRQVAAGQGLVRTLADKLRETPQIEKFLEGMVVRWTIWDPAQIDAVLEQTQAMIDQGLKINFWFPKWPSQGWPKEMDPQAFDALWQAYLHPDPVPGGWPALVDFCERLWRMGCLIHGFLNVMYQRPGAPWYDPLRHPMKEDGTRHNWWLSGSDDVQRNQAVLASLREHGLRYDLLYCDGYAAHSNLPEDFDPNHPCTRRQTYEAQCQCMADMRREGIMPGGELPRFWAMRDCDYAFIRDWSADRLVNTENQHSPKPVGELIPLFELVFHDCFVAPFAGGARTHRGYDWWPDRTPRLYELLLVASPGHGCLPGATFPYDKLGTPEAEPRWAWVRRMTALCQATKFAEMVSHEFRSEDRRQQRVTFANGVVADFDMAGNRYRITGVPGFSGDWETAPDL